MMNSVLEALREGRLVELPPGNKENILKTLAEALASNTDVPSGDDTYGAIIERERESNTSIGMGVAVPHLAAKSDQGALRCVVGWSPRGIDYGAEDKGGVYLVIMYYIPAGKLGVYLKEISSLAHALQAQGGLETILKTADAATVRTQLEAWILSTNGGEKRTLPAHLIKLESKTPATEAGRR
jgi:mannitol/fructose-specific phosphotransferase system IIA component (Ntr-type)